MYAQLGSGFQAYVIKSNTYSYMKSSTEEEGQSTNPVSRLPKSKQVGLNSMANLR